MQDGDPGGDIATGSEFKDNWQVLLGATLGIAGGFASLYFYSAGTLLKPMVEEFGWTRAQASLGAIMIALANCFAIPLAGRLVDRAGPVRPALAAMVALAIGFLALAFLTDSLATFLLLSFLTTSVAAPSNALSFNRIVLARFQRNRGLALGIALTGTGFGAAALPLLLVPFVATHGWRAGYVALAALVVPFLVAAAVCLRGYRHVRPPAEIRPLRQALTTRPFWTLALIVFLVAAAELGTVYHLVPLLLDRGMTPGEAGILAFWLGIAVIAGRIVSGWLLDRYDAGVVTASLLSLAALGMLLLAHGSAAALWPGVLLAGLGLGTESDLIAFLVARRFGLKSFGTIYGAVFIAHVVGAGIGPVAAGAFFDWSGSYTIWLVVAAAALLAAGGIAPFYRAPRPAVQVT